jgi:hypothetical protein
MTSFQGYTDGSYAVQDLYTQCDTTHPEIVSSDSIWYSLTHVPEFTHFKLCCEQFPDIVSYLKSSNTICTVFVPLESNVSNRTRQYVESHIVKSYIPYHLLQSTKLSLIRPTYNEQDILCEVKGGNLLLNQKAVVISYQKVKHSILYAVSSSIV